MEASSSHTPPLSLVAWGSFAPSEVLLGAHSYSSLDSHLASTLKVPKGTFQRNSYLSQLEALLDMKTRNHTDIRCASKQVSPPGECARVPLVTSKQVSPLGACTPVPLLTSA